MKIRKGFVSNSSSSSFIINKQDLTFNQIKLIKDHINVAKKMIINSEPWEVFEEDQWKIIEFDKKIIGITMMDNFDMYYFLIQIGIDSKKIIWD